MVSCLFSFCDPLNQIRMIKSVKMSAVKAIQTPIKTKHVPCGPVKTSGLVLPAPKSPTTTETTYRRSRERTRLNYSFCSCTHGTVAVQLRHLKATAPPRQGSFRVKYASNVINRYMNEWGVKLLHVGA